MCSALYKKDIWGQKGSVKNIFSFPPKKIRKKEIKWIKQTPQQRKKGAGQMQKANETLGEQKTKRRPLKQKMGKCKENGAEPSRAGEMSWLSKLSEAFGQKYRPAICGRSLSMSG